MLNIITVMIYEYLPGFNWILCHYSPGREFAASHKATACERKLRGLMMLYFEHTGIYLRYTRLECISTEYASSKLLVSIKHSRALFGSVWPTDVKQRLQPSYDFP